MAGALLLPPTTACERPATPSRFTVRDSAGVRIVESSTPRLDSSRGLEVAPIPILSIGTAEGTEGEQLYRVRDAVRFEDGRIAVANAGSAEVRIYGPDGQLLRIVGREGAGPGEFRSPAWLQIWHDTLVVYDRLQDNGRLSYFTLEGDYLSSTTRFGRIAGYASIQALLPDGSLLAEGSLASIPTGQAGYARYTRIIMRLDRAGEWVDTIGRAPGDETMREQWHGGMAQWHLPFGSQGMTAVGRDRLFLGNGAGFAITELSLDGTLLASIRGPARAVALTPTDVRQYAEWYVSQPVFEHRPDLVPEYRRRLANGKVPDLMPEYSALQVDGVGRLWVLRYSVPWTPANGWLVFDPDGRWLTTVDLPPGLVPFEIGADYVLGLRRDELDVEHLELYRIQARGSARPADTAQTHPPR